MMMKIMVDSKGYFEADFKKKLSLILCIHSSCQVMVTCWIERKKLCEARMKKDKFFLSARKQQQILIFSCTYLCDGLCVIIFFYGKRRVT